MRFGSVKGFLDEQELSKLTYFEVTTRSVGYGYARASFGGITVREIISNLTSNGTIRTWDCLSALGKDSNDKTTDRVFECIESSFNGSDTQSVQIVIE